MFYVGLTIQLKSEPGLRIKMAQINLFLGLFCLFFF